METERIDVSVMMQYQGHPMQVNENKQNAVCRICILSSLHFECIVRNLNGE